MLSLTFKPCRKSGADLDRCAALMASSSPWSQLYFGVDQCRELLVSPGLELTIAWHSEKFVGFIALRPEGVEGEPLLEYLCVAPEHRRLGAGKRLIRHAEERCQGAGNIYLFVSDFNEGAIKLYESLRYQRVGSLPDYNVYGQTEYLYRKTLRPRQQARFEGKYPGSMTRRQGSPLNYDLNSGYARMTMPEPMRELVAQATVACYEDLGRDQIHKLGEYLHEAFLRFLLLDDHPEEHLKDHLKQLCSRTFSTFSGSIALDRVFAAIRRPGPGDNSEKSPLTVILPEPSLDLWQHLLRERSSGFDDIQIIGVRDFRESERRTNRLIEELNRHVPLPGHGGAMPSRLARKFVVVADSPSNPQGFLMRQPDLEELVDACRHRATLVLDHCFLVAGLHYDPDHGGNIPSAYMLPSDESCNWFAVWDTGKSLDLAGDKVAFITASNKEMADALHRSLQVIQPATFTAQRSLEVLRMLFEQRSALKEYLSAARRLCEGNLAYLMSKLPRDWKVQKPRAGTFACVTTNKLHTSDEFACFWESAGIGVARGADFMVSRYDEGTPIFVRLSLYKPAGMFKAAVDHAVNAWPEFLEGEAKRRNA